MRAQPYKMAVEPRQLRQHDAHPLRLRRDFQTEQLFHRQAIAQVVGERRQVVHAVGESHRLLVGLDFEFLLDAGVQEADIGLALHDGFAIKLQQQAQHTVRGRVLRAHVERHLGRVKQGLAGGNFDLMHTLR